jgi:hypothetical protein
MRPSLKRLMFEEAEEVSTQERPDNEESVDRQILRAIMDAERNAVQAGRAQETMTPMEAVNRRSLKFIFEAEGEESGETDKPPLDVGTFAMEVMRVIKNFDTLLDIPTVILNKAKTYIAQKYDKKTADAFMELIQNEYDITVGKGGLQPDNEYEVMSHTAVGARTPSA